MVQNLNYLGEKYPIRISYYAIKNFQTETGKDISELDEDISHLETLLYYSLVAGHRAEKKEMTLTKDDMEFMLDECLTEFNDLILNFFPYAVDEDGDISKKK